MEEHLGWGRFWWENFWEAAESRGEIWGGLVKLKRWADSLGVAEVIMG
jgi:hypothetical protein